MHGDHESHDNLYYENFRASRLGRPSVQLPVREGKWVRQEGDEPQRVSRIDLTDPQGQPRAQDRFE